MATLIRPNYKRIAEFIINPGPNSRTLKYPQFTLEFEKNFDLNGEPDETVAKIFNPSADTEKAFDRRNGKNINFIINAGYEFDSGLVTLGEVVDFQTETAGNDRILIAVIHDVNDRWQKAMVTETFSGVHPASFIIKNVFDSFGIKATIKLGNDKSFEDKSISLPLKKFVEDMAKETDSNFLMRDSRMIFQPKVGKGGKIVFVLKPESGLVDRVETTDKGLLVKTIFNYRFRGTDIVKLEFREINTFVKVLRGIHSFRDKDAFTELEVVPEPKIA